MNGPALSISAPAEGIARAAAALVRLTVAGGAVPIKLYLYVDGELVEDWVRATPQCDYEASTLAPGRHLLTARAIDAEGRWAAASTTLDTAHV
jgi:poly(3-hydroxybutyrate) depolymerase